MIRITKFLVFCILFTFLANSQTDIIPTPKNATPTLSFAFKADPNEKLGFDSFENIEWKSEYRSFRSNGVYPIYASYQSVNYKEKSSVLLVVRGAKKIRTSNLTFRIKDRKITFSIVNDSTYSINLPSKTSDYIVHAIWKETIASKLYVKVYKEVKKKIIIVPLVPLIFSANKIEQKINKIYSQANIHFDFKMNRIFKSLVFEDSTEFSTPSEKHSEYTGQMRLLRDLYFETHPKTDKNTYYLFIVNRFSDSLLYGYMVKNKSLAFVKSNSNLDTFSIQLAQTLAFGVGALDYSWLDDGPIKGATQNLMDTSNGTHLTHIQWNNLQKLGDYYSYYDNEENIKTNNGTVGYYFWEEDKKGNIVFRNNNFLEAIKRPYKYNFLSYRFKVKYLILRPFYKIGDYYISILDLISLSLIILLLWGIRRKLKQYWKERKYRFKLGRRLIFFLIILLISFEIYENYWVTNQILYYFKQISGPIKELNKLPYNQAQLELVKNEKLLHQEVSKVCSEILVKRKKYWYVKKRSKVLYFTVSIDKRNDIQKIRFDLSSDSIHLSTLKYHKKARNHYLVVTYQKEGDTINKQEVYTHNGTEISSKFNNEDAPKRILLFVNGYRPTSIGRTFEENFSDLQTNGLEYPNSRNFIYDFDRYDYWRPWKKINLLFQKRINPSETYYADGHFSVATSNYKSLFNFSSISTLYPKRCKNPKKHLCHKIQNETIKQFIFDQSKTINQLKMEPNKKGFELRKNKGKIAGENLLEIINEIPDVSKNDTIFIVAHSMGFAYSQGIVEVLRGKINFGGYYIIAAENGESGKINLSEWKDVWQYGSNFDQTKHDAPCLQDGIAPQKLIPGITVNKRIFIPKKLYRCKGYFDSHFIGYYTWVLDIEKDKPGYIPKK